MAASAACALGPHAGARFPTFVANVRRDDGAPLFPASVVREVDGVRVGFIGAVTRTTPTIVVPSGVAGLQFLDEVQAINAEADRLVASGVRALVAVIHEGGATGAPGQPLEWNDAACPQPRGPIFDIVRQLHPRIGIVLSAHTHQGYRCVIDGRAVMQATALGRGVSVADLVIDRASGSIDRLRTRHRNLPVFNAGSDAALREAIIEAEPQPWATALKNAQGSAAIAARVAEVAAAVSPLARRRIGSIGGSFDRSGAADNAAGRLVADAQHRATREPDHGGAELALTNPGGVRTDLLCRQTPPCEVSYGDAFSMQPFGNSLVVMTLKGSELIELLESQQPPGRASPRFLQPSASLTYTWRAAAPAGRRVQDVRIGGRLLDPQRDVRLTVNSFLAEGGDGFEVLPRGRSRLGGVLELDALAAHLADGATPDPVARITMAE